MMRYLAFFALVSLTCFLEISCRRAPDGLECWDGVRYAVPEYYRPHGYSVIWRVDGCAIRFSSTLVASEEKGVNVEEFRRLAAQRGESGTKRFKHCTVYPLTECLVDIASVQVVRVPEGGGDTVDLSSKFNVEFFSYRKYIMSNYRYRGTPETDSYLLSEADSAQYKYVLDASFRINAKEPGGISELTGSGNKLSVVIRMVDGSVLPELPEPAGK